MRPTLLSLAALLALLAGCKKEPAPPRPTPVPTATPVPDKDVLGFTHRGGLWAMRYDGGSQKLLAQPGRGQSLWFPVPSPSGDHLVAWLSRSDGTQDLARVDLSGRITVLTETGAKAKPLMKSLRLGNAPSYSPDGKRIAYGFNGDLWIMDADGYNAETFIADGASWAPAFSPDGKRLAYINGSEGHFDVWMADIDSRDTWRLTDFVEFSVGQPRWNKDGTALLLTRSQGEDSDVVRLALGKESLKGGVDAPPPAADADPLTKDRLSGGAVFDPNGWRVLYSSARGDGNTWTLYSADASGGDVRQLTKGEGYSPFWMRPGAMTALSAFVTQTAMASVAPTAIPAVAPTPMVAPTALQAAAAPTVVAKAPAAAPGISPRPVASPAATPKLAAAPPTQPPAKAPPLRLRLKTSFSDGSLTLAGLADLKKLAPRVSQYSGESVAIVGPLDRSPLKGKFASEEARSLARAQAVADALTKAAALKPGAAKAQAYAPAMAGSSGPPNSIQIYVELK